MTKKSTRKWPLENMQMFSFCVNPRNTYYLSGKLDRQYLRVSAVYRLLMRLKRIDKARAIELLQPAAKCGKFSAKALVELWLANPKRDFA